MFAFGILTDFRTPLFPGSARLVELADRMHVLQVEALCWCGKRATHNARTENGEMVIEGEVIVVGDVDDAGRTARRGRPTRCSAASTTGAGSPPPGRRPSRCRPSRCRSGRLGVSGGATAAGSSPGACCGRRRWCR